MNSDDELELSTIWGAGKDSNPLRAAADSARGNDSVGDLLRRLAYEGPKMEADRIFLSHLLLSVAVGGDVRRPLQIDAMKRSPGNADWRWPYVKAFVARRVAGGESKTAAVEAAARVIDVDQEKVLEACKTRRTRKT